MNWGLKALIDAIGMKATPVKRKRTNGLSVPQPADSIQICPRHPRSEELCVLTKSAEDDHIKSKIDAALSQKDVRALCQLMQADAAAPAFDVDIQVDNLIVSQSLPCSTQPSHLVA